MSAKKRLMLFDDDEDIQSICRYILEGDGWEVKIYGDCVNIVSRVKDFQPHVILMDNWIPQHGGITATREIKDVPEIAGIPVIYFSANSDIQQLAKTAGADMTLSKPFDLDALRQIVMEALTKN